MVVVRAVVNETDGGEKSFVASGVGRRTAKACLLLLVWVYQACVSKSSWKRPFDLTRPVSCSRERRRREGNTFPVDQLAESRSAWGLEMTKFNRDLPLYSPLSHPSAMLRDRARPDSHHIVPQISSMDENKRLSLSRVIDGLPSARSDVRPRVISL